MAAMEGSDGPAGGNVIVRYQERRHLLPCAGKRKQIFQQVVREAAIAQCDFVGRWHGIGRTCARLQLWQLLEGAVKPDARELPLVDLNGRASDLAANAKDGNLPVLDRIRVGHAKDAQRGEVRA